MSDTYRIILNSLGIVTLFLGVCALWIWVFFSINRAKEPIEVIDNTVRVETVTYIPEEDAFFVPSEQENLHEVLFENEDYFEVCNDCPLDPELQAVILKTSKEKGINPAIVYAICESESTFRTDIGTEKLLGGNEGGSRFYGYMQLSEYNCVRAKEIFNIDAHTEAGNLEYGTILLAELVSKYNELDAVITAYKSGESVADSGYRLDCCDYITDRVMFWEERLCVE